ncbi:hypothetical protein [Phytohabitans aurantiacus]|uniref:hypothetical protein n=1 Tax=Phytohabitans aurantiacus TaxID=3016789 RepID=UPI0024909A54|nr:hypothetical protein [Phytohabitans aurantiacus]
MDGIDPHIHVDVKLGSDVVARDILASAFGLAGDVPATVTTGCGVRAPLAMTSASPERVTCLPCREYAHGRHALMAKQFDEFARLPGLAVSYDEAVRVAAWHRDLARRFAGLDS